jgi:glycosyltransferase involved in cell wall biosynthesis
VFCIHGLEPETQELDDCGKSGACRFGNCGVAYLCFGLLARTENKDQMRIGIDARFLTHPQHGGFKTYTECLIAALAQVDTENEYILYLDRSRDWQTKLPDQRNFTSRVVPGLFPFIGLPWREQVSLSRCAARDRLDLLHSPCLTAPLYLTCPSVVTIHDMIWYFPERYATKPQPPGRRMMELYYRLVPRYAAFHASSIVTVSQASKQEIVQDLHLSADRVFVTYEAARRIYQPVRDEERIRAIRSKHNLNDKFILAIGSADPRKNISTLVNAFGIMPDALRAEFKLVVVWTHPFLTPSLALRIKELGLENQVRFLQSVSDEDLVLLYNVSSLFVFPSLYEGFGLPLLEAMACGTPVVAADNSSIPEIAGDAALLFEAHDAQAIADTMTRVLTNDALRLGLAQKGLGRAEAMTWDKCARQTVDVYRQALRQASSIEKKKAISKNILYQKGPQ